MGEIFEYLCREFDAGKRMALERYEARLHEYPARTRRPRPSIWDHEADESDDPDESVTSPLDTVERLEQAFDRAYPTVVISHGGQIANRRLQTMLQARFGEQWRCAEEPRSGVVDGLMHLYTDLKAGGRCVGSTCVCYMGWQETTKSRANGSGTTRTCKYTNASHRPTLFTSSVLLPVTVRMRVADLEAGVRH